MCSDPPEHQNGKETIDRWNSLAKRFNLRPIRELTPKRRTSLANRLKAHPRFWEEIEAELPRLGQFAREKKFLDFDFLVSPTKLPQFLEGKYRDKGTPISYDPFVQVTPEQKKRQALVAKLRAAKGFSFLGREGQDAMLTDCGLSQDCSTTPYEQIPTEELEEIVTLLAER